MIPTNGFIQAQIVSGGGLNEEGIPIPISESWGEQILARIQTNTYSNKGKYQDGKFIMSSYIILIQKPFSSNRVKINLNGVSLGEFDVQNTEVLKLVGRVKIVV